MGLDMYLERRSYVKNYDFIPPEKRFTITIKIGDSDYNKIDINKISNIVEEVGYWRKANQIHNWFVENVQEGNDDCEEYYVDKSQLESLLENCKEIIKNNLLAEELLPIKEGFFFGTYEYDEWYFNTITKTIEILTYVLETTDFNNQNIYYSSSW